MRSIQAALEHFALFEISFATMPLDTIDYAQM